MVDDGNEDFIDTIKEIIKKKSELSKLGHNIYAETKFVYFDYISIFCIVMVPFNLIFLEFLHYCSNQ